MDNKIIINVDNSNEFENLVLTIPYSKDWKVKINGTESSIENFENLMKLNIVPGKNEIELTYTIKSLNSGIIITCFGIILMITSFVLYKKRR